MAQTPSLSRFHLAASLLLKGRVPPRSIEEATCNALVQRSDRGVFRALIAVGASPEAKSHGLVLWSLALHSPVLIRELLQAGGARSRDDTGRTAVMGTTTFHFSSPETRDEVVAALYEGGADIDARDLEGRTALMVAAHNGSTGVFETLLRHGTEIEARDPLGRTAFLWAAIGNQAASVKALAAAGADVNARDNAGMNALMLSARENKRKVLPALLRVGVDLDARNIYGQQVDDLGGYSWLCDLNVAVERRQAVAAKDKRKRTAPEAAK